MANICKIRLVEENGSVLVANDAHSHSRAVAGCARVGLAEIVRFDFDLRAGKWIFTFSFIFVINEYFYIKAINCLISHGNINLKEIKFRRIENITIDKL